MNSSYPPGQSATRKTCAQIMAGRNWKRMPGREIRWHAPDDQDQSVVEFLPEAGPINEFCSVDQNHRIQIIKCADGGIISYEVRPGRWLHTLQPIAAFRNRIFEMNLMPVEELGAFLETE
ncbi:hypothetical protein [Rubinisphaera margarita]|uniref:hypothetical protein n=1 Tax=Rubinisphaera margarita TaxID=2909586 RepID=UPI001EE7E125|nr:hypothetical protein [Rubinisphaera margarita]MCG6156704.1 hypothetical protein [Rubinisphaera margarita]